MNVNPNLCRSFESVYLHEKTLEYYTPAISRYQQESSLPTSSSVMEMGIAITTDTAQSLPPSSSLIPPAYYCPFPLPSRSTSLRATSVMISNPPPVPPKDIKDPPLHSIPSTSLESKHGIPQTPVFDGGKQKRVFGKSKRLRKRIRGVFNRKVKREFYSRKSTVARLREGMCVVM